MIDNLRPKKNELHEGLQGGGKDKVYADRDYEYRDVGELKGCYHVRTCNDDKNKRTSVSFELEEGGLVYVLYDSRADKYPDWLRKDPWRKTGLTVKTDDKCDFVVFSAKHEPGQVKLGSNQGDKTGAESMYTVLIQSASESDEAAEPEPTPAAPTVYTFPDLKHLGCEVGGGWRMILSKEGTQRSVWDLAVVKKYLNAGMAEYEGGRLVWRPRYYKSKGHRKWSRWKGNPSQTVWKQYPKSALRDGVTVKMRFKSSKDTSIPNANYEDRWYGGEESNDNLRNVAGTGDFRIGLLQTNGRQKPGMWNGYQVRVYPYLHREAKNHIGKNDRSNCSYWYRNKPGGVDCLMDDYSQYKDRDGFKKLKHDGELKFGMGPHSPYDEFFDIAVRLKLEGAATMRSWIKVNDDEVELDPYEHDTAGFREDFEYVDAVCLSYNNMRPYVDINIECDGW